MEKIENVIDDFLGKKEKNSKKKVFVPQKTGLIERVDKELIVEDGRLLLKD